MTYRQASIVAPKDVLVQLRDSLFDATYYLTRRAQYQVLSVPPRDQPDGWMKVQLLAIRRDTEADRFNLM